MKRIVGLLLGVLVAALLVPGVSQAQGVVLQGTIQEVDCQSNAIFITAADGSHIFPAPSTVFVNSTPVPFCTLQQYIGSDVRVTVEASGSRLVATRVEAYGEGVVPSTPVNVAQAAPIYAPAPQLTGDPLGWMLVGGLLVLLTVDHYGVYRQYPYYGPYYPIYHRPYYHRYLGWIRGPLYRFDTRWGHWRPVAPPHIVPPHVIPPHHR
jgi:hypothetical protein